MHKDLSKLLLFYNPLIFKKYSNFYQIKSNYIPKKSPYTSVFPKYKNYHWGILDFVIFFCFSLYFASTFPYLQTVSCSFLFSFFAYYYHKLLPTRCSFYLAPTQKCVIDSGRENLLIGAYYFFELKPVESAKRKILSLSKSCNRIIGFRKRIFKENMHLWVILK